jgi:putative CocE/NonD family hydrolase
VLYAASSARDTDFVAKLVDVHPDGRALNVSEGILRARYRRDLSAPELLEPGEPVELAIRLYPTAMVFKAGHRIRLDLTSSHFPRFSRNLNTGEPVATASRSVVARQTVLHSSRYPSHVLLPRSSAPTDAR